MFIAYSVSVIAGSVDYMKGTIMCQDNCHRLQTAIYCPTPGEKSCIVIRHVKKERNWLFKQHLNPLAEIETVEKAG